MVIGMCCMIRNDIVFFFLLTARTLPRLYSFFTMLNSVFISVLSYWLFVSFKLELYIFCLLQSCTKGANGV